MNHVSALPYLLVNEKRKRVSVAAATSIPYFVIIQQKSFFVFSQFLAVRWHFLALSYGQFVLGFIDRNMLLQEPPKPEPSAEDKVKEEPKEAGDKENNPFMVTIFSLLPICLSLFLNIYSVVD